MKLLKATIHNFRLLKEVEIDLDDVTTVIVMNCPKLLKRISTPGLEKKIFIM